jgi:hypothetical protein
VLPLARGAVPADGRLGLGPPRGRPPPARSLPPPGRAATSPSSPSVGAAAVPGASLGVGVRETRRRRRSSDSTVVRHPPPHRAVPGRDRAAHSVTVPPPLLTRRRRVVPAAALPLPGPDAPTCVRRPPRVPPGTLRLRGGSLRSRQLHFIVIARLPVIEGKRARFPKEDLLRTFL